jgi:segregation and condensation protein B
MTKRQQENGQEFVEGIEMQAAKQRLEALLFSTEQPVGVRYLARRIGQEVSTTRRLLEILRADYANRGVHLEHDGQLYCFSVPERLSVNPGQQAPPRVTLSPQGMEILALLIAKGPLPRKELLEYRGVTSDKALISLVQRGFLTARRDYLRKAVVYDVSATLLEHWGFTTREELVHDVESRRRGL